MKLKKMVKHISCGIYFNSPTCNWNQKCNNETFQCECKNYHTCKKDYSWNSSTHICKNGKYLKSVADTFQWLTVMKFYMLLILYKQICVNILVC